jgi:hypothetical protein
MRTTMTKATSTSKGSRQDEEEPRRVDAGPTLPYAKAFVVQFTAETGTRLEPATGRVEHLLTGQRFRFASIADLVACIRTLLASPSPSPKQERSSARTRRGVSRGV